MQSERLVSAVRWAELYKPDAGRFEEQSCAGQEPAAAARPGLGAQLTLRQQAQPAALRRPAGELQEPAEQEQAARQVAPKAELRQAER